MYLPDDVFKYILEFVEKPLKKCESCNVYVATSKCDTCENEFCEDCMKTLGWNDEFKICTPCVEVKHYVLCETCGLELTRVYCQQCNYSVCSDCSDNNNNCYNCDEVL